MDELRVAVIGVGRMGMTHAENLANRVRGARLVAVTTSSAERAAEVRRRCDAVSVYARLDHLLEGERLDAAVISSATSAHVDNVEACARAGLHMLCEKPLVISLAPTKGRSLYPIWQTMHLQSQQHLNIAVQMPRYCPSLISAQLISEKNTSPGKNVTRVLLQQVIWSRKYWILVLIPRRAHSSCRQEQGHAGSVSITSSTGRSSMLSAILMCRSLHPHRTPRFTVTSESWAKTSPCMHGEGLSHLNC